MSDKEKIRTILFDWHKWRDYYYSDLKDEVITDDEWKTTRDKIDDEAIANIQALIQEQVRLARIDELNFVLDNMFADETVDAQSIVDRIKELKNE